MRAAASSIRCDAACVSCRLRDFSCSACAAGRFSERAFPACEECPAGYDASISGAEECFICARGRYATESESKACLRCARGYYASNEGSTACTACPAGKFADDLGRGDPCATCENPEWCTGTIGQKRCIDGRDGLLCAVCADGFFVNNEGECITCPDNDIQRLIIGFVIVVGVLQALKEAHEFVTESRTNSEVRAREERENNMKEHAAAVAQASHSLFQIRRAAI